MGEAGCLSDFVEMMIERMMRSEGCLDMWVVNKQYYDDDDNKKEDGDDDTDTSRKKWDGRCFVIFVTVLSF